MVPSYRAQPEFPRSPPFYYYGASDSWLLQRYFQYIWQLIGDNSWLNIHSDQISPPTICMPPSENPYSGIIRSPCNYDAQFVIIGSELLLNGTNDTFETVWTFRNSLLSTHTIKHSVKIQIIPTRYDILCHTGHLNMTWDASANQPSEGLHVNSKLRFPLLAPRLLVHQFT